MDGLAASPHDARAWQVAFEEAGDGTDRPDMNAIRLLRTLIWLQTDKVLKWTERRAPLHATLPDLKLSQPARNEKVFGQLSPPSGHGLPHVKVVNSDILRVAEKLKASGLKVAVLNMANASSPGGGFQSGRGAQEENLHRRTDAVRFTARQRKDYYPIPSAACLLSHGVTVFRGTEAEGYRFLAEPFSVSMISCAAIHFPRLTSKREYAFPRDEQEMRVKIRFIIEAARRAGCDAVALSAFGCGAFGNPPERVAEMFREELIGHGGTIRQVVFCILDDHNACQGHNPRGNFAPFLEAFSKENPRLHRPPEVPAAVTSPPSLPSYTPASALPAGLLGGPPSASADVSRWVTVNVRGTADVRAIADPRATAASPDMPAGATVRRRRPGSATADRAGGAGSHGGVDGGGGGDGSSSGWTPSLYRGAAEATAARPWPSSVDTFQLPNFLEPRRRLSMSLELRRGPETLSR